MSTLFVILSLLSLVGLVVGLIKPEKVKLKSRKKVFYYFGGAFLGLIILTGITAPPVSPEELQARETARQEKAKQAQEAKAAKEAAEQKNTPVQTAAAETPKIPEQTPEQLLEAGYKSEVKNIGGTNFSYMKMELQNADSDRPAGSKMVTISVKVNSFLSKNSLMRNTGELTSNLFKKSLESSLPITDYIVWYYADVKDIYGNNTEDIALSFASTKDTIQKINWGGFDKTSMCDFLRSQPTDNFDNVCVQKINIE
ncbi:hypothetical protein CVU83_03340 [Candidatus Falkowbacteria bacterium HGW-Falkowbacteria-2]|uniref:Uncharacterized protein n=1 Tax=Candidatus Falkowbacteria bacterium HGW-Falkowbacteria-2 TaxID=2013769 RepID=A0A2N2DXF6_9BACT|nr:MAG: hypothetical protein CVU83_03340 [Candidatus Falkowbacteria bacterium HGW-Falkowbacteria-2]